MKKYLSVLGMVVGFFCLFVYLYLYKIQTHDQEHVQLTMHFFAVGQGDATFIETPGNKRILVDGGPDAETISSLVGAHLPSFSGKIDLIILTHPHKDHIAGLKKIIETYPVGNILLSPIGDNALEDQLTKLADTKGIPRITADPQIDLQIDEVTYLDVIAPTETEESSEKNLNNKSVVFMLRSGTHKILFTGDAEKEEEERILLSQTYVDADILKGGHHGSKTSTSPAFLEAVSPETVIYMNGIDNTFGHPAPETLERLEEKKIPYYNTSINGTITVVCPIPSDPCIYHPEHPS